MAAALRSPTSSIRVSSPSVPLFCLHLVIYYLCKSGEWLPSARKYAASPSFHIDCSTSPLLVRGSNAGDSRGNRFAAFLLPHPNLLLHLFYTHLYHHFLFNPFQPCSLSPLPFLLWVLCGHVHPLSWHHVTFSTIPLVSFFFSPFRFLFLNQNSYQLTHSRNENLWRLPSF